jgi:hypothetical protein
MSTETSSPRFPVWQQNRPPTRRLKSQHRRVHRRIIDDEPALSVLEVDRQHTHDFDLQIVREHVLKRPRRAFHDFITRFNDQTATS